MGNPSQTNVPGGSGRNQQQGPGGPQVGKPAEPVKPEHDANKREQPANGGYHPSNVKNR